MVMLSCAHSKAPRQFPSRRRRGKVSFRISRTFKVENVGMHLSMKIYRQYMTEMLRELPSINPPSKVMSSVMVVFLPGTEPQTTSGRMS